MKSLAIFLATLAIANASSFLDNEEAQEEARLFYTSNNGNMYVGLNATYIWALAGLVALGVVGIFVFTQLERSGFGGLKSASGYNRYGQEQPQFDYYQTDYQNRQKRFAYGKYQHL